MTSIWLLRAPPGATASESGRGAVEQIKKFVIIAQEWMADSERLRPTMKRKRRGVAEKYEREIDGIYA
ncbi:MAG: hypothetical protein HYR89_01080 [Actinobacteria bacterium]|nr:hypothetical protein [Actinomycetota bacterium]